MDDKAAPGSDESSECEPYLDGFTGRTILGALFVAFIMMPGSIYLGLVAGQSLGPAAEWVTIILFAELARRSLNRLKRQEVFVLFYVASAIASVTLVHVQLAGGPFAGAIWNQYLLQSPQTSSIAAQIPDWVVPPANSPAIQNRDLLHPDWWRSASRGFLSPATLILVGYLLGRLSWFGLGYLIFRLTSDSERLPFPLAPIAAEGATALAESTDRVEKGSSRRRQSWRWNVFSAGACLGLVFGSLYVLLPVATGLFMAKPVMIFPIPFIDFSRNVESALPASLVSISFDASIFLAGMILPFPLVVGTFVGVMLTSVLGNPLLERAGAFPHWHPGNGLLVNQMILGFDFWISVTVGLACSVALLGLGNAVNRFARRKPPGDLADPAPNAGPSGEVPARTACRERGDLPVWTAISLFVCSSAGFVWISHVLVPDFPVWIVMLFGFVVSPLHSYISARLIGLTGQPLGTPMLKETAFILSGYKRLDIWFAPIPLFDHGYAAQRFRELELTRTRFTSIFKAELFMFPIVLLSSFLFWWLFWHLNQTPSDSFPFAARLWPIAARQAFLIVTANSSDTSLLLHALRPAVILGSLGAGLGLYAILQWAGAPVVFFYGLIGGAGAPLHGPLSLLLGALLGHYYFRRKFGAAVWARYVPVAAAGFACGMGLAGMTAVALALVATCTRDLPF